MQLKDSPYQLSGLPSATPQNSRETNGHEDIVMPPEEGDTTGPADGTQRMMERLDGDLTDPSPSPTALPMPCLASRQTGSSIPLEPPQTSMGPPDGGRLSPTDRSIPPPADVPSLPIPSSSPPSSRPALRKAPSHRLSQTTFPDPSLMSRGEADVLESPPTVDEPGMPPVNGMDAATPGVTWGSGQEDLYEGVFDLDGGGDGLDQEDPSWGGEGDTLEDTLAELSTLAAAASDFDSPKAKEASVFGETSLVQGGAAVSAGNAFHALVTENSHTVSQPRSNFVPILDPKPLSDMFGEKEDKLNEWDQPLFASEMAMPVVAPSYSGHESTEAFAPQPDPSPSGWVAEPPAVITEIRQAEGTLASLFGTPSIDAFASELLLPSPTTTPWDVTSLEGQSSHPSAGWDPAGSAYGGPFNPPVGAAAAPAAAASRNSRTNGAVAYDDGSSFFSHDSPLEADHRLPLSDSMPFHPATAFTTGLPTTLPDHQYTQHPSLTQQQEVAFQNNTLEYDPYTSTSAYTSQLVYDPRGSSQDLSAPVVPADQQPWDVQSGPSMTQPWEAQTHQSSQPWEGQYGQTHSMGHHAPEHGLLYSHATSTTASEAYPPAAVVMADPDSFFDSIAGDDSAGHSGGPIPDQQGGGQRHILNQDTGASLGLASAGLRNPQPPVPWQPQADTPPAPWQPQTDTPLTVGNYSMAGDPSSFFDDIQEDRDGGPHTAPAPFIATATPSGNLKIDVSSIDVCMAIYGCLATTLWNPDSWMGYLPSITLLC